MAIYTIADLHLSGAVPKSMEKFGRRWTGYTEKLEKRWRALVTEADTVVIPGDISWGMNLEEAEPDLRFIASLPGEKYLGKGNHDFWWTTVAKMERFLLERSISGIHFLYNNAFYTEGLVICGTRGWFLDERQQNATTSADYGKLIAREAIRLELCLREGVALRDAHGGNAEICVFLHFPPVYGDFRVESFLALLRTYGVRRVWFGHIHGNYVLPPTSVCDGISFSLISADYLDFYPARIFV